MYASIDSSTYAENTIPVSKALSHKHTMQATLPNLEAASITLVNFLTSYPVLSGDAILVFSTEFPTGFPDIAGTVVDNLDGTFTVPFTATFAVAPSSIYRNASLTTCPQLYVQAGPNEDRIITSTETLTFVSSADVQFVGTNVRAGMLAIDDTITITDGVTPTEVILTAVVESGTAPVTYTCDYASAIVATGDATILSRSTLVPAVNIIRNDKNITITYANVTNLTAEVWSFIGRIFYANLGWTITEPFIMNYTEEI